MRSILIFTVLLALSSVAFAAPGDILSTWSVSGQSYNYVRGLEYDWNDGDIWCIDNTNNYAINYCKFDGVAPHNVVLPWALMSSSCYWGFDIAYDGTYLYVNDESYFVDVIDPSDGSLVDTFPVPCGGGDYPEGIGYDQDTGYLYHDGFYSTSVWVTDTSGGAITTWTGVLPSGGGNMGIAYGGGKIWVIQNTTWQIFRFDPATGTLETSFSYNTGGNYTIGLSWSPNDTLYTSSFISGLIYEIETDLPPSNIQPASVGIIKAMFK